MPQSLFKGKDENYNNKYIYEVLITQWEQQTSHLNYNDANKVFPQII